MDEKKAITVKPVTWREDGYPCFVSRDCYRKDWDRLDDKWKEIYLRTYTYIQKEYDEPDPDFADIATAVRFGFWE